MSIGDVIGQVDHVLGQARHVEALLDTAEQAWIEGHESVAALLTGSSQPEVGELAAIDHAVRERFDQVRAALRTGVEALTAYRDQLTGGTAKTSKPLPVETVRAPDGSHYPPASAWCADMLPRRVVEGTQGEKTVGYVAHSYTRFVSGIDGTWTPAIEQRMRELRIGSVAVRKIVRFHVEMKVATMMIAQGRRTCELTINHVTCGSQSYQPSGCHQVLRPYLPTGYTLIVHGTTQQGKPYSYTFEGQA